MAAETIPTREQLVNDYVKAWIVVCSSVLVEVGFVVLCGKNEVGQRENVDSKVVLCVLRLTSTSIHLYVSDDMPAGFFSG